MLIYEPVRIRTLLGSHAIEGYYASPAFYHHRNFTVFSAKSRAPRVSTTVEFLHAVITMTKSTPEDKAIHATSQLKIELACVPTPNKHDQIEDVANLRNLFSKHSKSMTNPNETTEEVHTKQE